MSASRYEIWSHGGALKRPVLQQASDHMVGCEPGFGWHLAFTGGEHVPATGREGAAGRELGHVGRRAGDRLQPLTPERALNRRR